MEIRKQLAANPAISSATRGGEIRQYYDKTCSFESYVEAETHTGETFVWLLDVSLTATRWSIDRSIVKQATDGQDPRREFDDAEFDSFDDMIRGYSALMNEFVESVSTFSFDE